MENYPCPLRNKGKSPNLIKKSLDSYWIWEYLSYKLSTQFTILVTAVRRMHQCGFLKTSRTQRFRCLWEWKSKQPKVQSHAIPNLSWWLSLWDSLKSRQNEHWGSVITIWNAPVTGSSRTWTSLLQTKKCKSIKTVLRRWRICSQRSNHLWVCSTWKPSSLILGLACMSATTCVTSAKMASGFTSTTLKLHCAKSLLSAKGICTSSLKKSDINY